jgi:hypothetical protein
MKMKKIKTLRTIDLREKKVDKLNNEISNN